MGEIELDGNVLVIRRISVHYKLRAPVVKGFIWGATLWLLAQLMVMPMMGGGIFSSKMGGMTAVVGSLVGHIVYGALLGLIAGAGKRSRTVR